MLIHSSRSSFLLLFYQAAARDRNVLLAEPSGSATAPQDGYSCGVTRQCQHLGSTEPAQTQNTGCPGRQPCARSDPGDGRHPSVPRTGSGTSAPLPILPLPSRKPPASPSKGISTELPGTTSLQPPNLLSILPSPFFCPRALGAGQAAAHGHRVPTAVPCLPAAQEG